MSAARSTATRTDGVRPPSPVRPPLGSVSRPVEATGAKGGGTAGGGPGRPSTGREAPHFAALTASAETVRGPWGAPPRMAALLGELLSRLLEDPSLAERVGHLLAIGPGLPPDVHLLGSRLTGAALAEPLRRGAPKRGRGRPGRWGRAWRETEEERRRERERLVALRRGIVSGWQGRIRALFEAERLDAVLLAFGKARRAYRAERERRLECGPTVALHAPQLWAARVLLEADGEAPTWDAAARLAKRLTGRAQ